MPSASCQLCVKKWTFYVCGVNSYWSDTTPISPVPPRQPQITFKSSPCAHTSRHHRCLLLAQCPFPQQAFQQHPCIPAWIKWCTELVQNFWHSWNKHRAEIKQWDFRESFPHSGLPQCIKSAPHCLNGYHHTYRSQRSFGMAGKKHIFNIYSNCDFEAWPALVTSPLEDLSHAAQHPKYTRQW